ncbi:MAG: bifunctional (p)ppGpp synthetase/guanosine-3',5'-bis(diphosphate) 3'-pyrophosphohydrolase [Lachnospiraceae bacterium]|jgi:guanosine-3',5'-bis(diphosphate) 3'-pyrophosphohydrolase|nr:bifunctional (p)ppGpp synthetase/guanosine-3',5'-bis(diphosphate) 3'-pyrophosphohydrolase [Lachnospiraceae bacterium]
MSELRKDTEARPDKSDLLYIDPERTVPLAAEMPVPADPAKIPRVSGRLTQEEKHRIDHELGTAAGRAGIGFDDGRIEEIEEYVPPETLYRDLIERVREYHPSDDITMIEKAYHVADKAHAGQLRKSGEPYIIHPLYVAIILADLEMDKETIAAGLLHDVVEDTILTQAEILEEFGPEVALLVDGVTKLSKLQFAKNYKEKTQEQLEYQALNLRKMFLAMAKDIRVILIKLADRLHNMRTLDHQPPEKQQSIAQETLDIYSPIAQRLGISRIKVELDDLSLKYLKPEVYYDLVKKVTQRKQEREKYVQEIAEEVRTKMTEAGIEAEVDGRVKHFFSIYKKMINQGKSLDQIYDLFAVRIIVNTVKDCYAALGVIHEMYTPMPGRFKDYIAMPKPNNYRSLHTTLVGTTGQPFEIQIRTYEMHREAEYGIAAHWKYKEASNGMAVDSQEEEKLSWLRQILEWQQDMPDNKTFMDGLKSNLDLFSDDVYCFTPNGEVKTLPVGSTPIDFAYAIHTAVGNKMIGARVNGKLVNIDYQIQNGDRVEILTSQNSKGPSRDWLNVARSPQTRNKINQWFKNESKEENVERGKELILAYCRAKGLELSDLSQPKYQKIIVQKYGFHDWEAVLAAVGHGGLKEGQVVNKLQELYEKDHEKVLTDEEVLKQIEDNAVHARSKGGNAIVVKGIHDVAVRFAKCCNPVPGDEIVGFVTRGRGVTIHRTDCVNMMSLPEIDRARLIDADWEEGADTTSDESFEAEIVIYADDRSGLLNDVSRLFTEQGINILDVNTRTGKQGNVTMNVVFRIKGKAELNAIIERLHSVRSVIDVSRAMG